MSKPFKMTVALSTFDMGGPKPYGSFTCDAQVEEGKEDQFKKAVATAFEDRGNRVRAAVTLEPA
jgi:hypothetical protein